MNQSASRPRPRPDELTKPFWDAARAGRLVIQRCRTCGYYNHPPKPLCDRCSSAELDFEPVSGRGKVYSYTVMRQPNVAGFEADLPYLNLLVELVEQPELFLISRLPGDAIDEVRLGRTVEVYFETVDAELTLPQFHWADSAEGA